jgi:prolipoprotein diacylglyceryl transferase
MRPILFELPLAGRPVYAYGTLLYLSLVVGWMLTLTLAERDGLGRRLMRACFIATAVAALIGARLLFVLTNLDLFNDVGDVFDVGAGGLVAYGGFLGGLCGSMLFCRVARVPVLVWADCAVPSLCTGLALTRVGCLLAGCDFGTPWDGAWAVRFPRGSPAFEQQVAEGLLSPNALASLSVHPTQVYESLAGLCLLALVLRVRHVRRAPGEALAAFGLGYAVLRYGIEILRADAQRGAVGPFSTSQIIALLTGAAAIVLLSRLRLRSRSSYQGRDRAHGRCAGRAAERRNWSHLNEILDPRVGRARPRASDGHRDRDTRLDHPDARCGSGQLSLDGRGRRQRKLELRGQLDPHGRPGHGIPERPRR